LTIKQT